jgi:hypothetical protein
MSGPRARVLAGLALAGLVGASCAGAGSPTPTVAPTAAPTMTPSPAAVVTATPAPTAAPSPSPTPASTPAGTPPAVVVGTFTIVSGVEQFVIEDGGTMNSEGGVDKGRGLTLKCVDVANDPRVSGTTVETWNYDFAGLPPEAGLDWGVRRLENDGGVWEGIVLGAAFPGSHEELTMWLTGSGGYAGLTYYMHVGATASPAMTYAFEGIIYEGTIPIPTFREP